MHKNDTIKTSLLAENGKTFQKNKNIFFNLKRLYIMIIFFCFLIVPIGHLRGQVIDIFAVDEFNIDKIIFDVEDERLIDINLIADQQKAYFDKNGSYFHIPDFACLVGRCQVDEYKTYQGERGYIIYFKKEENEQKKFSTVSTGIIKINNDWENEDIQ